MTDTVLFEAIRDRSFAGLFPYSNNTPMKVFAGHEPSVPVSVLIDALDEMQAGGASHAARAGAKASLVPQFGACVNQCQKQHESCLQMATNGGSLSSLQGGDWNKCHQSLMNVCMPQCSQNQQ